MKITKVQYHDIVKLSVQGVAMASIGQQIGKSYTFVRNVKLKLLEADVLESANKLGKVKLVDYLASITEKESVTTPKASIKESVTVIKKIYSYENKKYAVVDKRLIQIIL